MVRIHYRRLPDREEVFQQRLLLDAPDVKITLARDLPIEEPLMIAGRPALEPGSAAVWFTFPGAWHDIGRFHLADGTFTGIYANILTPPVLGNGAWDTTDLFLDVWIEPSGTLHVLDEDQLEEALRRGWVDPDMAERARQEVGRIVTATREGRWPPSVVSEWTLARALAADRAFASGR